MALVLEFGALRGCSVADFARLGAGLFAHAEAQPEAAPLLAVVELAGEALLLGRHQRLASCVNLAEAQARNLPLARRNSGGRTLFAGHGRVGVLLALPDAAALLEGPATPDKWLNRYVRGVLAGLTKLGARGGAHYFGRDFVSAESRQLAMIGQENGPRAVLFEAVVAIEQPLALPPGLGGYPEHSDPRAGGPPPVTLAELRGEAPAFPALVEGLAQGYAAVHGCTLREVPLPALSAEIEPPPQEDEGGWSESGVCDIPIGFLEALTRRQGEALEAVRLRGDFLAPSFVVRALERSLRGAPLSFEALGPRVDAAFHLPGACLHGLRELRLFADAVLAAQ